MATKANLVIDQGSDFETELYLLDQNKDSVDLSGFTANAQIRRWYTSASPAAEFTTSINTTNGILTLSLTNSQTSNLVHGRYVYDVELVNSSANVVSRIVEGIVTVTPQVTR